ncbi:MAG: hypothetical protein CMH34_09995 [Microbacterium sp.]|nr:hypothetical protein [Microbacterium sp.]
MALEEIRPGVSFRPDAAASWRRVEAEIGRELQTSRTSVDYDEQADLYALRQAGQYPYSVAHPDVSNHVYRSDTDGGNAVDTDEWADPAVVAVLEDHGWWRPYLPPNPIVEQWHNDYDPARDNHRNDTPALKEDDMILIESEETRKPW